MGRRISRFVGIVSALAAVGLPICAGAARIVDLDAAGLKDGVVSEWKNNGTLGGNFNAPMSGGAVVGTVDGRKAVTFDGGKHFLKSSFGAPESITGKNAFSVAVWVYNPTIDGNEEPLVYWAHRGTTSQAAHLNYGNAKNSGAIVHWGGDMGYQNVPEAGKWHLVVVTYAGGKDGVENLYVDGKLDKASKATLNLFTGDPIYIGTTDLERFFSGSLAEIKLFDYVISDEEIANLMGSGGNKPRAAVVDLSAAKLAEGAITEWDNDGTAGGSFGLESPAPKVAEVGGRKAVTFNGKNWLQSSFDASLGTGPCTVEFWVYRTETNPIPCPVFSIGDQATTELARFGYSTDSSNGAFFSGKAKIGFNYPAPAKEEWHQMAFTRAADGTVTAYVDGELEKSEPGDLVKLNAKLQIGGAWIARRGTPIMMPQAAVSRLRVYDEILSQKNIRNNNELFTAFGPSPANNGTADGFSTSLKWNNGDSDIKGYNVYMGVSKEEVASADSKSKAFKASLSNDKTSLDTPIDLVQTYYWRVDEIGLDGNVKHQGDVWSFSSETGRASALKPRTEVAAVPVKTSTLSWTPGKYASSQTVYFSENLADVKSGKAIVAKNLKANASQCRLKVKLQQGKTYYWQVSNKNGKHPETTGDIWSFRTEDKLIPNDVTFLAVSDLHYGVSPTNIHSNQMTVDFMNNLPGVAFPKEVGGNVLTPRGVVISGDLTNDGKPEQWALFTSDYGVNGEGRIVYPVYEGWGNHDGSLAPGAAVAPGIAVRNKTRTGVKNVSKNGFHYSWDWERLHMVHLNFYPGDMRIKIGSMDGPGHEPQMSLEFLKEDLAKNVGKSGRPVIILQHLGFDEGFSLGWNWWNKQETEAFYEVIKDYNVVGILYGHTHAAVTYKWRGFDIYNCASGQRDPYVGECMVFHATPTELIVIQRFKDKWGEIWRKPITGMTD